MSWYNSKDCSKEQFFRIFVVMDEIPSAQYPLLLITSTQLYDPLQLKKRDYCLIKATKYIMQSAHLVNVWDCLDNNGVSNNARQPLWF